MSQQIPVLESGLQIGDYTLGSLIESDIDRQVWSGEQVSVKREVEVVCYYGPDPDGFLTDIRVKAIVEDGVFGLVYEAIPTEEFIAFAREALPSKSLASVAHDRQHLLPIEVTRVIAQVAGAMNTLERRGIARTDFDGKDIRLGLNNTVRIRNLAKAGPAADDNSSRQAFASVLRQLLEFGQPGATRMGTLLDYIEGTELQEPIPWSRAEKLAHQVDEQLGAATIPPPRSTPILESKKSLRGTMIAGLIFGVISIIIGIFAFQSGGDEVELDLVLTVPEGRYPRPNGGLIKLSPFRIDASEVTIEEYSEFMIAWQSMTQQKRQALWPEDIPEDKTNVRPAHWNQYFPLARAQKTWEGRKMALDCPVIGVDWWSAQAYATWKNGRLPTEQEWWAASSSLATANKQRKQWGPVGGPGEKIYGLAGNVAEWAAERSKNPAFPIDSAKPVVLGGSFKKIRDSSLTREWVDNPSVQRDDIGFRLVYSVKQ
ncbi:MAG: formylglycine-generating enzyme family protein [Roseibacillus sp.]